MKNFSKLILSLIFMGAISYGANVTFYLDVSTNTPLGDTIFIMGNKPELGSWDPHAVALQRINRYRWLLSVDLPTDVLIL